MYLRTFCALFLLSDFYSLSKHRVIALYPYFQQFPLKSTILAFTVSLELSKVQPRLPHVSTDCKVRLQMCLHIKPDHLLIRVLLHVAQGPVKKCNYPGQKLSYLFQAGYIKLSRNWYLYQYKQQKVVFLP